MLLPHPAAWRPASTMDPGSRSLTLACPGRRPDIDEDWLSLHASIRPHKVLHRCHRLGEAHTLGGDLRREGVEQARGQRVEQHEDAAVVGAADEPAKLGSEPCG